MKKKKIVCAAIRAHGVVFHMPRPARHCDLIKAMAAIGVPTPINGTSGGGFMTSEGKFVNRTTAKMIAYRAGQITYGRAQCTQVFCTEDLW